MRLGCRDLSWVLSMGVLALGLGCDDQVDATLNAYDALRVALTEQQLDVVASQAHALSEHAKHAAGDARSGQRPHFEQLAGAARQLAVAGTPTLFVARRDFQEISRHFVALLETDQERRQDYFLFECATLSGYNRWVQSSVAAQSPYHEPAQPACVKPAAWGGAHCPFDYF